MEGLIAYAPFWLGYLTFAAAGYWCWEQMFFWLRRDGDMRRFLHMLGAVLLFTPAPIAENSAYFAPAFVVLPFVAMSESMAAAQYVTRWLLGALFLGVVILSIRQLIAWARTRRDG